MAINWVNAPAMWYRGSGGVTSLRLLGDYHSGMFAAVSNASNNRVGFHALVGSRSGWVYGTQATTAANSPLIARDCPPLATRHWGARYVLGAQLNSSERPMFAVRDEAYASGITHLTITADVSGVIRIRRGTVSGALLATSAASGWLVGASGRADFWSVQANIHDSTGSCTVYRNGEEVVTFSGDTQNGGVGTIGAVVWYLASFAAGDNPAWFLEDLYIGDSSGSVATSALPDLAVDVLNPDGDGDTAEGTANTGTATAAVNDAATGGVPDGDATFVALESGEKHLFSLDNLTAPAATIYGVQHSTLWRKDDAGAVTAKQLIRSGGNEYVGASIDPGVSYTWQETMRMTDPATTDPWGAAGVNALQAGVEHA